MRTIAVSKTRISLALLALFAAAMACNANCQVVERADYVIAAREIGQRPETPRYPAGAVYQVCYVDGQVKSVQMEEGQKPDAEIPAGTYTGTTTFYSTLDNDVDNSYLAPVCTENTVRVVIGSDGAAQGEIRSICYADKDTDNEEMRTTHHSEVTGLIQGELLADTGQLTITYNWHDYLTSPQWETTSLDNSIDFEFPYQVQISAGVMTLSPAGDVENYYSFTLSKE